MVVSEDEKFVVRFKALQRHVHNVQGNCQILGEKLIERGEKDFALQLIANGYIHDNSKFYGIEWQYLHGDVKETNPELFQAAALQHITTNFHHPEAWHGISNMPRIYIAEMACDLAARSTEFGNDVREWIRDNATKKYNTTPNCKCYKQLMGFVNLLLEPKFK